MFEVVDEGDESVVAMGDKCRGLEVGYHKRAQFMEKIFGFTVW